MKLTSSQQAEVLVHALPYIQKYYNKIIVVKYGGNAMINEDLKKAVMGDIVLMSLIGIKVVLVHGGGPEITDTAEIVQMVLAGKINKNLVNLIQNTGGKAIGLSGMDGHLIEAKVKDERLGLVGDITNINVEPILDVLDKGYIPVVSTVGCDKEGRSYNINADIAASIIAGKLKAESFISMTDIKGILRDKDDPDSLISKIYVSDTPQLMSEGIISGGMIPKIQYCTEAIRMGVSRAFIIDGRVPHSILIETLTDEGIGTMFLRG